MNYGLQISASGMFSALHRQDVLANNLANANTPGFKPDVPTIRHRASAVEEDGLGAMASDRLLERLGAGAVPAGARVKFAQGTLTPTGNELDVGIEGRGFLVARVSSGEDGLRLTRDGRLTLDARGRLVTAAGGFPIVNERGVPITLDRGARAQVDGTGIIRQRGQEVARLRFVEVGDEASLKKEGEGLFAAPASAWASARAATGVLKARSIEESAVDEVRGFVDMGGAARDVEANVAMIQHQDRLMERAINVFGRVA